MRRKCGERVYQVVETKIAREKERTYKIFREECLKCMCVVVVICVFMSLVIVKRQRERERARENDHVR